MMKVLSSEGIELDPEVLSSVSGGKDGGAKYCHSNCECHCGSVSGC